MKIGVVGLGSMGQRRIRLLKKAYPSFEIIGVDRNEKRCMKAMKEYGIRAKGNLDKLLDEEELSAVFVCTDPLSHSRIIIECIRSGCHVFSELNLVSDGYKEIIQEAYDNNICLFMSSTFLYRREIREIQNCVQNINMPLMYKYSIGQYLPTWHPWESYKDFFVNNKRTNGCREIMAIEFPWLVKTFGEVVNAHVMKGKQSRLDIDYPDYYLIQFEHASGHKGCVTIDLLRPLAKRRLEIVGQEFLIEWDGTPDTFFIYDKDKEKMNPVNHDSYEVEKGYSSFIIEEAYAIEIEAFITQISKGNKAIYSFEEDAAILALIDKIES